MAFPNHDPGKRRRFPACLVLVAVATAIHTSPARGQSKLPVVWSAQADPTDGSVTDSLDMVRGVAASSTNFAPVAFVGSNKGLGSVFDRYIELRDKGDGQLETPLLTPGRIARSVSYQSHIFVVGDNDSGGGGDTSWFIDRFDKSGNLTNSVTVNPTTLDASNIYGDKAHASTVHGGALYVVGKGGHAPGQVHSWRIEKRLTSTSMTLYWVQQSDPGYGFRAAYGVAGSGDSIYVAGVDVGIAGDSRWVVEMRSTDTGELEPGFGSGGRLIADITPFHDIPYGIAADETRIYVVGHTGDAQFNEYARVEARDRHTGALLWSAGGYPGVANAVALDGNLACVVGYDETCGSRLWRIDLYRLDTGELVDTSFPACPIASEATCVDSLKKEFYIGGYQTNGTDRVWCMEKRVVDLDQDGIPDAVDSSQVAPTILNQPQGAVTCAGWSVTLQVAAAQADSFQWRKNGALIPGATSATYAVSNFSAAQAGTYDVIVANIHGYVISTGATLSVGVAPAFTSGPSVSPAIACVGGVATLTTTVTGNPAPMVDWYLDAGLGPTLIGSGATLNLSVTAQHEGAYHAVATNACDSAPSGSVSLIVGEEVEITNGPQSQAVPEGTDVTLVVEATGDPAPSYQWYRNGAVLVGETSDSLYLPAVTADDADNYAVEVANACTPTPKVAAATVAVFAAPLGVDACDGCSTSHVLVSWSPVANATHYQVYRWLTDHEGPEDAVALLDPLTTSTTLVDADVALKPGVRYSYAVAAANGASGALTSMSSAEAGYSKLPCLANVTATGSLADRIDVFFDPDPTALYYGVFRQRFGDAGDPKLLDDVWHHELSFAPPTPQLVYNDFTAEPGVVYRYWVVGSMDEDGTIASDLCGSADGVRLCSLTPQFGACSADPSGLPAEIDQVMLVLLDRSCHMAGVAAEESVMRARQDILAWFAEGDSLVPVEQRLASVWAYHGDCVYEITQGFVAREVAVTALDNIADEPALAAAPLADALCMSADKLFNCAFLLPPDKRTLAVYSSGKKDHAISSCGMKPELDGGSDCGSFTPPSSWPAFLCAAYFGSSAYKPTVMTAHWFEASGCAPELPGSNPADPVLAAISASTGGIHQPISGSGALPSPFFNDCNGNGAPDDQEIQSGVAADCNANGIPDDCEVALDCDGDGVLDACEIAAGTELDLNGNGKPDSCEGLALSAAPLALAGLPLSVSVINATPDASILFLAGFTPTSLPLPGCGGAATLGILDFASYGVPLMWVKPTDATGQGSLQLPIPELAAGFSVLFQALELPCQSSAVAVVAFK